MNSPSETNNPSSNDSENIDTVEVFPTEGGGGVEEEPIKLPVAPVKLANFSAMAASKKAKKTWVTAVEPVKPPEHLIPDRSGGRRARVGAHVVESIHNNRSYYTPYSKDRPKTMLEKIMALRLRHKMGKLATKNALADNLKSMYLEDRASAEVDERINFKANWDNLSSSEKRKANRERRRHNRYQRRLGRLEYGRQIPFTDRRVMGVKSIAANSTQAREERPATQYEHLPPAELTIQTEVTADNTSRIGRFFRKIGAFGKTVTEIKLEDTLKEISKNNIEVYNQALEVSEGYEHLLDESAQHELDTTLVALYHEKLGNFRDKHKRDPSLTEEARLKLRATERAKDELQEVHENQLEKYNQILEVSDRGKDEVNQAIDDLYHESLANFRGKHRRDPYLTEKAHLHFQATDEIYEVEDLSRKQAAVYDQLLKITKGNREAVDGALDGMYRKKIDQFKKDHKRGPRPIEDAGLRLKAVSEVLLIVSAQSGQKTS